MCCAEQRSGSRLKKDLRPREPFFNSSYFHICPIMFYSQSKNNTRSFNWANSLHWSAFMSQMPKAKVVIKSWPHLLQTLFQAPELPTGNMDPKVGWINFKNSRFNERCWCSMIFLLRNRGFVEMRAHQITNSLPSLSNSHIFPRSLEVVWKCQIEDF